jgi:hypothetical protein
VPEYELSPRVEEAVRVATDIARWKDREPDPLEKAKYDRAFAMFMDLIRVDGANNYDFRSIREAIVSLAKSSEAGRKGRTPKDRSGDVITEVKAISDRVKSIGKDLVLEVSNAVRREGWREEYLIVRNQKDVLVDATRRLLRGLAICRPELESVPSEDVKNQVREDIDNLEGLLDRISGFSRTGDTNNPSTHTVNHPTVNKSVHPSVDETVG